MGVLKWKPIAPLTDQERKIDLGATPALYESWFAAQEELRQSGAAHLNAFVERLVRRFSIETGIIEKLYDLDRGTTEVLVAKGFLEDLVTRADTNIEPSRLIDILRDQQAAIALVMDCVAGTRALSKNFVHQLHETLTQHQATTEAIDTQGKRFEIPLIRGRFKESPNNPRRPDGEMHEYCPPIHVDSEMESLLGWLSEYDSHDPIIVAAWLHHRFTQIHPYQDGNGRVARALTTLVAMKADLLPLVVDRDRRADYIQALEEADKGQLADLAKLFASLERSAILQALSVDVSSEINQRKSLTAAAIDSLAAKFSRLRVQKREEFLKVNDLAERLRSRCERTLANHLKQLKESVPFPEKSDTRLTLGGPDQGNAYWYKHDVIKSSKGSGKYVNFSQAHYFVKSSVKVGRERLVFVVSFHHVGRELSGIMEVTTFANLESADADGEGLAAKDYFSCSLEPFVIAWKTELGDVEPSFDQWLDAAFAVAINEYGDRLKNQMFSQPDS